MALPTGSPVTLELRRRRGDGFLDRGARAQRRDRPGELAQLCEADQMRGVLQERLEPEGEGGGLREDDGAEQQLGGERGLQPRGGVPRANSSSSSFP